MMRAGNGALRLLDGRALHQLAALLPQSAVDSRNGHRGDPVKRTGSTSTRVCTQLQQHGNGSPAVAGLRASARRASQYASQHSCVIREQGNRWPIGMAGSSACSAQKGRRRTTTAIFAVSFENFSSVAIVVSAVSACPLTVTEREQPARSLSPAKYPAKITFRYEADMLTACLAECRP